MSTFCDALNTALESAATSDAADAVQALIDQYCGEPVETGAASDSGGGGKGHPPQPPTR